MAQKGHLATLSLNTSGCQRQNWLCQRSQQRPLTWCWPYLLLQIGCILAEEIETKNKYLLNILIRGEKLSFTFFSFVCLLFDQLYIFKRVCFSPGQFISIICH